jgi:hypothetical protein
MNTNLTSELHPIRRNRRSARVLGAVAVGAALTAGLVGCGSGTDDASNSITALKATTTVPSDTSSDPASDAGVPVGGDAPVAPVNGPSDSNAGQQSGGSNGGGQPTAPKPVIDSFVTPENIDCHNGDFQQFSASWTTTHASKVTISIDGPGVYAEYSADGETSLPFSCSSSHSFLLTAHGDGGTATRTIVLDPRNVQDESSGDEDEQSMPMGTTAKVSGGSTGEGPASQRDCDAYATQIDSLIDIGVESLQAGGTEGYNGAIAAGDEASRVEDQAMSLGCFFVY